MRRFGPLLLIVVVASLVAGTLLFLRGPASGPAAAGSHDSKSLSAPTPAPSTASALPDRVSDPAAAPSAPRGPNTVRGNVRYASDGRAAAGVQVRVFTEKPSLRSMRISQEMRRGGVEKPAAAVQDLSEFGPPSNGPRPPKDSEDDDEDAADPSKTADALNAPDAPSVKDEQKPKEQRPVATTTTKVDGTFELAGLAGNILYVDALSADHVSTSDERVAFNAGPLQEGVVLSLAPGARVRGRVHDEEGRPVAKATVTLSVGFDPFSVFSSEGLEMCPPANATTDDEGRYAFEAILAPRTLQAQAVADGFAAAPAQKLELKPGDDRTLDLLLPHGATVIAHVADESGAPVKDARCTLEPTKIDLQNITGGSMRGFKDSVKSDADGRAYFRGVAAGDWRVRARLKDRLQNEKAITVAGPGSEISAELVLARGRMLAGVVVASDGTPLAGADISAFVEPSLLNIASVTRANDRHWKKSDEQGRFTLVGLPDDKLQCEAQAKGYRTARTAVAKDQAECRVELAPLSSIEGVIVSKKTNKPVTRFDLKVVREKGVTNFMSPDAAQSMFDVSVPFATPNGKWKLVGVNPGKLRLFVRAAEHGEAATDWMTVVEGEPIRGVIILLEPEAVVEGVVVDAAGGAPIEGARIHLERGASAMESMMSDLFGNDDTKSDAKGQFRIGELAAGTTRFVASKDGFVDASSGDLALSAGESFTNLRFELMRGGEVWGVVSDAQGAVAAGVTVMCQDMVRLKLRTTKSDDAGEYRFKGLDGGNFSLTKLPANLNMGDGNFVAEMTNSIETHTVKLKAGEVMRVDFNGVKVGAATIEGRVTQGKAPVEGALVNVILNREGEAGGAGALKSATTAADGTFRLENLEPGTGVVQVNGPDFGMDGGASAAIEPVKLVQNETTRVEIAIPTGNLRGKVVDAATGAALAGVAVYAASADPGANPLELATRRAAAVHTDAEGAFVLKHLRSGRFVVTAGATDLMASAPADHAVVRTPPIEVAEGRDNDVGTIRLPKGGRIEGTVTDRNGKPMAGASLFLRAADGEFLEEWTATSSDSSGHFVYGGVPDGTWDVLARASGHATSTARGVRVVDGRVADIRIALMGGTEVFADVGDVAIERLYALKLEVDGPDGRIPLTLFGLGDLTDLFANPPRPDVVRLGRFGPGEYRVHGTLDGKTFEKRFTLKGEAELHIPVELPH